ncbi:MAG: hypothetical protein IKO53_01225 [Lachnospiraceae bacterium]|nr:hypothetical protein [Lachnospiraceae bacterium]
MYRPNDKNWKIWKIAVFILLSVLGVAGIVYIAGSRRAGEPSDDNAGADAATPEISVQQSGDDAGISDDVQQASGDDMEAGQCLTDSGLKYSIGPYSDDGLNLEKVVVLSRHNIRSPLTGPKSSLYSMTPYSWCEWSSRPAELSVKGGTLETEMGQYFRRWLEDEGLFEENYRPAEGEVRIYANSWQRTVATARFFSTGLMPVSNMGVEHHKGINNVDAVFYPKFTYCSATYRTDALAEMEGLYYLAMPDLSCDYRLLTDVLDMEESEAYKKGSFTGFSMDVPTFNLAKGTEPTVNGSLKTACQLSDALILQYYEEPDRYSEVSGRDLTWEEWEAIGEIKDIYGDVLFTSPLVAVNIAHPLLVEMDNELNNRDRRFSFICGHDSNLASVLAALDTEDYRLPEAIEKRTPIGGKFVISLWKGEDGAEYMSLDLVYQKAEQMQNVEILDEGNPPGIYGIRLKGLEMDENGLYKASDVMGCFEEKIEEYDTMKEKYK